MWNKNSIFFCVFLLRLCMWNKSNVCVFLLFFNFFCQDCACGTKIYSFFLLFFFFLSFFLYFFPSFSILHMTESMFIILFFHNKVVLNWVLPGILGAPG